MSVRSIYLDYHATTPVDPRVWAAMEPHFREAFGNPASQNHRFGRDAAAAVATARRQVGQLIGAPADDIIFTSGATESNNLALKGAFAHAGGHVIVTTIEHRSVLEPAAWLERHGCSVTRLEVNRDGRLPLERLQAALRPETRLVSIIAANNEIGVLQDMPAIGRVTRAHGARLHTDATQAVGKIAVNVDEWGVDLLSLTAHKLYGPKGVGALYLRKGVEIESQLDGGGQERGLRSGTLNVPGIVGLGAAAAIAAAEMSAEAARLGALRDRLRAALEAGIPDLRINGSLEHRLPHNLHITIPGLDGEAFQFSLPEIAVSSGSACTAAARRISHVLRAIGLSEDEAHASIRIGLGRWTTEEEIDYAAARIAEAAEQLRALSGSPAVS